MVEVEVMPSAQQDIKNIIEYVYRQSVQNAEKLYVEISEKINSLQQFPERGSLVKEIETPQLREVKLYHLRIIYTCPETKVQILTIHHSAKMLINNPYLKDLF